MSEIFTVKQVIAIRKDLHMSVGKMMSQACHASLEASEESKKQNLKLWKRWRVEGAKKVLVKVNSYDELMGLEELAIKLRLPNSLIIDRGLTQLSKNTPTAIGIGPAESNTIDRITGDLKLF